METVGKYSKTVPLSDSCLVAEQTKGMCPVWYWICVIRKKYCHLGFQVKQKLIFLQPPLQLASWMHCIVHQNAFTKMKSVNVLNDFPSFPRMLPPEAWPIKNLSIGAQWGFFCTSYIDFFRSADQQISYEVTRKTSIFSACSIFSQGLILLKGWNHLQKDWAALVVD